MDIVYCMPAQPHRLFVNVVHACPNACAFCVDFTGQTFYGYHLKIASPPSVAQMMSSIIQYSDIGRVREVYFCGIGEPLLRYEQVILCAQQVRRVFPDVMIALNTSGTYYRYRREVDFATHFDLVQVSLNAESPEKYDAICRPKFPGMYAVVRAFLDHLRSYVSGARLPCRVELSVVDVPDSDECFLPPGAGSVPRPDLVACAEIAREYGWPLKVKRLMQDQSDVRWERGNRSVE